MTPPARRVLAGCTAAHLSGDERSRIDEEAAVLRRRDADVVRWAPGCGVIAHDALTLVRVDAWADRLVTEGRVRSRRHVFDLLIAADRIASAAMWLVAHMTYARRVHADGRALSASDFKTTPEGHTGGSLNMVPAYVGYLAANALTGITRAWVMGQGHCVAAIDATNVLVGNLLDAQAQRYDPSEAGLSRLVDDFYSYAIDAEGRSAVPIGSHVNAHTAGGVIEGGYLGFAELLYPHIPLPGERLVAFLSDGAFEEQRGSDWAPRWWRPQDCGLVAPIMVLNGRRIDQRSSIAQSGGERWLHRHLELYGFVPVGIDGRDPASYVAGILEIEHRLGARLDDDDADPRTAFTMPYGVAEAPKGFGLPAAGTNRAHNLPLSGNPSVDAGARDEFNRAVQALRVEPATRDAAAAMLCNHAERSRPRERDHAIANRDVAVPDLPEPRWCAVADAPVSPMATIDETFLAIVRANPRLRVRVGNPDELRSNRLDATLDHLRHRVFAPEPGVAEAVDGAVITALNEEAVACAALGNKGGINLVVTYEAFGMKMLGALRQEIIFARNLAQAGRAPRWLSVPIALTSHTWENGKNEQSHQDPSLAEALLGEMADTSRVLFPPDANSAAAMLQHVYERRGCIAALIVPKREMSHRLAADAARTLARRGALVLSGDPARASVIIASTGAYQLDSAARACARLTERGVATALVYLGEPARLRSPRDALETAWAWTDDECTTLFPRGVPRVFVTHTHPEPYLGMLRRIDTGTASTRALGYINRGGTLDVDGMLFANRCTWAHTIAAAASVLGRDAREFLSRDECDAIEGHGSADALGGRETRP